METSLSTSQIKETVDENMNVVEEITEDAPEEKPTEVKEEVKKDKTPEPQKSVTPVAQNTVTVVAQIESDTKQNSNVEESEYETDTDESEVTVYNRPVEKPHTTAETDKESVENPKKPSKTVTIDDEKNEEKVYRLDFKRYLLKLILIFSEWGDDSQVKFSPFKSLRNSFRRLIGKEELPKKSKMKTDDADGSQANQPAEDQPPTADQSHSAGEVPTDQSATTPSNSNETEPQPPSANENTKKKSSACIIL